MEPKLLKNKSPEAKELLSTISGWVLRRGMLFLNILFVFIVFSSFRLIYFDYETRINAYVTEYKELNINNETNINNIKYISIGNKTLKRGSDFNIYYNSKNSISLKITSPDLTFEIQENSIEIILHHKKSLFEIIIGDIWEHR